MRRARWAAGIAAALTAAACSPVTPTAHSTPATSAPPTRAASSASTPPTSPPPKPPAPRVVVTRFRAADGSVVTLARFAGPVQYRLHCGSSDPGAAALPVVRAGPAIGGRERHRLLAAFNGGFLLSAGDGGYEQEGHVISRLRPGFASLVIDRSGTARIGIWGHGLPLPHEAVYSVRQNLGPLVINGHPAGAAANWNAWGATLGGGEFVARSAVGQNAQGQLIYAASMSASPADLAAALARDGARIAMELDINPEWVQLDVARKPGRVLHAAIPGQNRPAGQYLAGWTRDYFTALGP
jgi:hypothetical protein